MSDASRTTDSIFIPERFQKMVILHITKNLMQSRNNHTPLLLGIHGPSGEGKTFQCHKVLSDIDARLFLISGGQLEAYEAGEPAKLIRSTYLLASRSMEANECFAAVLLINDIDTGIGDWGERVQYTVNRQTVFGELMHIVDYPTRVENRRTRAVPIIITGNDFTKLYGPLVRAGRMTSFEWVPSEPEKANMVAALFPEIDPPQAAMLLRELGKATQQPLPMSFFSHLRSVLFDDRLWEIIQQEGPKEVLKNIQLGKGPQVSIQIDLNLLIEKGKLLLTSGHLVSHLKR